METAGFPLIRLLETERARFALWAPVCLGAGIAAYFALPEEPSLLASAGPLALAAIIWLAVSRGTIASAAMSAVVLACGGFLIAKVRVETVRAPVLSKIYSYADVRGTVTHAEPRAPRGLRVTLGDVEIAGLEKTETPEIVRIRILRDGITVHAGDRLHVKATLSPPAKPALPGGFDFARSAWFDRLGGVGYAYTIANVSPGTEDAGWRVWLARQIESARLAIAARIKAVIPDERGAIAAALIMGERGGISAETNSAYRNSGLFHILSISGLHMVVMAGAVFYLIRLVLACFPAIALRFDIKKWAAAGGIVAAFAYLVLSGGAFATVRSALMITIIFSAILLDRPALSLRNVAMSAFAILAFFPESLFDAGFQMSFAAVTGLVAAYEYVQARADRAEAPGPVSRFGKFFSEIVFSTLIASVAVAPIAIYHFHQTQQYAVLANVIAIPVCNVIVMPAALAALVLMPFGLEALALYPMAWGIDVMTWCANKVAALPGAVGHVPAIPTLSFSLIVLGGLWLALWQQRWRLLGLVFAAAGLVVAPLLPRPDVLIGRGGDLVAIRAPDGRLSALPARQSKYELERWLEYDGDGRSAAEVQKASAFDCDQTGCTGAVAGDRILAASRHASAIGDDCAKAQIVVLNGPRPKPCAGDATVIDFFDIWRDGAHALYIHPVSASGGKPGVEIDTVAAHRGDRPWSKLIARRAPGLPRPHVRFESSSQRLPGFATRPDWLSPAPAPPRPEIEDDDGSYDWPEASGSPQASGSSGSGETDTDPQQSPGQ